MRTRSTRIAAVSVLSTFLIGVVDGDPAFAADARRIGGVEMGSPAVDQATEGDDSVEATSAKENRNSRADSGNGDAPPSPRRAVGGAPDPYALRIEVAGLVASGTSPEASSLNTLQFGLGGRAGVSLSHFYVGVSAAYFLTQTYRVYPCEGCLHPLDSPTVPASSQVGMYDAEIGYGWTLGRVTLRPRLDLGLYLEHTTEGSQTSWDGEFFMEPGLLVMVSLGQVFLGLEQGLLIIPHDPGRDISFPGLALTLSGQCGVSF